MNSKHQKISVSVHKNELSANTINEMWTLYRSFYHCDNNTFLEKLKTFNYISFFRKGPELVGFIGIETVRTKINGRNNLLLRFGQVIIDRDARGKSLIPTTGAKLFRIFWKDFIFSKTYFWADALTYKSYLVFSKTLEEFYPTYKEVTPHSIKNVIDFIGKERYGNQYNATLGVVEKKFKLVNDYAVEIQAKYLEDKDIQFFASINAKHREGNGLITIAPASFKNLWILGKRYVKKYLLSSYRKQKKITPNKSSDGPIIIHKLATMKSVGII